MRCGEAAATDGAKGRGAPRQGQQAPLQHGELRPNSRKGCFGGRVTELWNRLAREAGESPTKKPPECDPASLLWVSLLSKGLDDTASKDPFQPHSVIV